MPVELAVRSSRRNPTRPQPRGEERRSRLLNALARHLDKQALADVSVAAVAEEAGLARSAFYFYFKSKNEAVTYLLAEIFDAQIAEANTVLSRAADPRENVSQVLHSTVQSWISQRSRLIAMLDARDADAEARSRWESWLARYEDFVASYIDDHLTAGRYPVPDSRDLAHSLISMNERVLERHMRGHGLDSADDVHRSLVHIWTATIFGSTAP